VTDSKSVPFGGAGSSPANVFGLLSMPNWRNGSAPAYGAGGCGFDPHVGLGSVLVAQLADRPLHTRKAQGSIPCENLVIRYFAEGRAFNPPREL
jgi:hypothetical protein